MATVDFSRSRRIVQRFWDPEPTNDTCADQPVWCLGLSYTLATDFYDANTVTSRASLSSPASSFQAISESAYNSESAVDQNVPLESSSNGQPLAAHTGASAGGGGWPRLFLDDFESRLWMTYRSDFEPIPRSSHPDAVAALSLPMRVKSQLVDQNGFSSDSGWGCMIRSGQSLLANAISARRLGRSTLPAQLSSCSLH